MQYSNLEPNVHSTFIEFHHILEREREREREKERKREGLHTHTKIVLEN